MKILILSAHTDDAEFGCGGTIVKYLEEGHEIKWLVFSGCEQSLGSMPKDTLLKEFNEVVAYLKINDSTVFDMPVRLFPKYRQVILHSLVNIRRVFNPDLVIGPSVNDIHQDHSTLAHEMTRAFKCSILSYNFPWNNFQPKDNYFVKLTEHHLDEKVKIIGMYKSQAELRPLYCSKDFIRGLAVVTGTKANCKLAESFEVVKLII